jgi:hypothetical protein
MSPNRKNRTYDLTQRRKALSLRTAPITWMTFCGKMRNGGASEFYFRNILHGFGILGPFLVYVKVNDVSELD